MPSELLQLFSHSHRIIQGVMASTICRSNANIAAFNFAININNVTFIADKDDMQPMPLYISSHLIDEICGVKCHVLFSDVMALQWQSAPEVGLSVIEWSVFSPQYA